MFGIVQLQAVARRACLELPGCHTESVEPRTVSMASEPGVALKFQVCAGDRRP